MMTTILGRSDEKRGVISRARKSRMLDMVGELEKKDAIGLPSLLGSKVSICDLVFKMFISKIEMLFPIILA